VVSTWSALQVLGWRDRHAAWLPDPAFRAYEHAWHHWRDFPVANVGRVTTSFPRELTTLARSLLNRLLAEELPGADELRVQAEAVRVKGYGNDLSSSLLLEVVDDHAPQASVVHTVPVEARA
jgi:hypothetical protein